jgi:ankyrin repeat protein
LVPILTEIDLESKIVQVETHRQNGTHFNQIDSTEPSSIFVVFKSASENDGEFWWSLEKTAKHAVVLQRSRDKNEVKNKFKGEKHEGTQLIAENLEGKGCMRELLTLLWIHMIVDVKYQRNLSRCESIIPLVMKKITKIRYEYKEDFTYSALSAEERNADLSEIINLLLNVSNWHPLVVATYLGDAELFDRLKQNGKYNITGVYNNFTLLNLAILFDKTEMVQHLLERLKADPTKCDEKGRNALHMAAKFNREKKIIELLLDKIPIDQCDATGTTALHHAIMASNTDIVKCLLDNGADPTKMDRIGRSPLCVAASYTSDTKIVDFLLQKKERVDVNDCDKFGVTALHHAARVSNIRIADHLLARGANINCRDKEGLTPLHVAAFFAKDMELIDLFLNDKKVNLRDRDQFGQNFIAYADKNTYGLRQEIIDRVKEIDDRVIKEYNVLKLTKSEIHIPFRHSLIWDLHDSFSNAGKWHYSIQPFAAVIASVVSVRKWKLFYVPFADLKPGKGSEISESALVRYIADRRNIAKSVEISNATKLETCDNIFDDLDPCSQITQIQIYEVSNHSVLNLTKNRCIVVFKTTSKKDGEHWWSLERKADYIVLQRSRSLDAVINKSKGKARKDLKFSIENLLEKGSIKKLLTILWIHQVMEEFNQNKSSNSQSFVNFVRKPSNEIEYESNLANQSDGNPVTLDLIQTLTSGICKWHPLYLPIYLGNTNLYDRISEMTKFNHFNDEISMLNLAITFRNKTGMVRHILEKHNADPTIRDVSRRNALETAAIHTDDTELLDLLLKHENVKIDGCDECGRTALHFATPSSNVVAARHLIKRGATPNLTDSDGHSPLHLAAEISNTEMINLLLEAQKQSQGDDGIESLDNCVGITALHCAAIASNEFPLKHLIKRWADPNRKEKFGRTPLHFAEYYANDINIVDVLLNDKRVDVSAARMDSDGTERKTQLDDPHCTTLEPRGSLNKFSADSVTSFEDFFFYFLYSSPFSKTSSLTHILLILLPLVSLRLLCYFLVVLSSIKYPYDFH